MTRHVRTLIVLCGLLLLCLIWTGLYYYVQSERKQALAQAVHQATAYSRAFEEHIMRTIRGLDQIVLFLKYQVEKEGWAIDVARLVAEKRFAGQPFVQLGVANAAGEVVANNIVPFVAANVWDREHFQTHLTADEGKLFVSKPLVARVSGKWSIQLSRRINRPDGSFGGIAVSSIDPHYLADFYQMVNLGEKSAIALVGRDGIVRVWQVDQNIGAGEDIRQSPLMEIVATGGAGTYSAPSPLDGVKRIYSYRELRDFQMMVVVGVAEEQVFGALNQRLNAYYWFAGAMSAVVVLYVWLLLINISRRRQNKIQSVLQEIAETAVVADSLDELYAKIHQSVAKVLPAHNFFVALVDRPAQEIVTIYCVDATGVIKPRRPLAQGFTEYVLQQDRVVYLTATDFAMLWENGEIDFQYLPISQSLGAPLRSSSGEVFGVIALFLLDNDTRIDGRKDPALMAMIAAQVSIVAERKRTEQVLRSSQARYRALLEQSFEALAVIDIETQEVVEVNRRFSELLGYSLPQDAPLYVRDFVVDTQSNLDNFYKNILKQQAFLPPAARTFRHKNGLEVFVERAGSRIELEGRAVYLASMRDMTAERRRQGELARDVEAARRLQSGLLPEVPDSAAVSIRTLYYPVRFVSGDSYHMEWSSDGTLLRGFLIDVSGHGLATAIQTASVNVLLREAAKTSLPLVELMRGVNASSAKYFTEDTYVAMLGFELDLPNRELRYVGAGITQFYHNGQKIATPGMFVGVWPQAEFLQGVLSINRGDTLYFLTDGFTDVLTQPEQAEAWTSGGMSFEAALAGLAELADEGTLRDDATAICLKIKQIDVGNGRNNDR